jgi:hypothetical protein
MIHSEALADWLNTSRNENCPGQSRAFFLLILFVISDLQLLKLILCHVKKTGAINQLLGETAALQREAETRLISHTMLMKTYRDHIKVMMRTSRVQTHVMKKILMQTKTM